jgi:uncharacterized DUF497 family protein
MAACLYEFEWDPVKAQTNFTKHGLDFEFEWLTDDRGRVRMISARRPANAEIRDYEEQS